MYLNSDCVDFAFFVIRFAICLVMIVSVYVF